MLKGFVQIQPHYRYGADIRPEERDKQGISVSKVEYLGGRQISIV
jgi:hypothetical protein